MIAEYLKTVLAEGTESDVITAIGHIAKSIGMTKIAQETGFSWPNWDFSMHVRSVFDTHIE